METAVFTKGPWAVSGKAEFAGFKVVERGGRSVAAFPSTSTRPNIEREANARLIAAAPDLLEALRGLLAQFDQAHTALAVEKSESARRAIDIAQAALAKAGA